MTTCCGCIKVKGWNSSFVIEIIRNILWSNHKTILYCIINKNSLKINNLFYIEIQFLFFKFHKDISNLIKKLLFFSFCELYLNLNFLKY